MPSCTVQVAFPRTDRARRLPQAPPPSITRTLHLSEALSDRAMLLTGFATVELAVTALTDYGAFTFLRKESFQRSQFKEIVKRILVSAPQAESDNR
ncbi:MAG: hypothetical protein HGA95_02425 [Caldiserica bacterium]|nr:hypothetical protein [Caldisericota bacterium]